MKKLCLGIALLLSIAGFAWAQAVTVYDVGVEPDSPNKKVTVSYRLNSTNAPVANVAVEISSDAGTTWGVPANTFYPGSDVGPGIPADGTLKELVWDARSDWNEQYSTQMIVRLNATASEMADGLFFVAADTLYRMNLDGSALTAVYSGLPKVEHLAIDYANSLLMINTWYSGSSILAYDMLRGGTPSLLYNGPGITGAQGLALDESTSTLFQGLYYNGVYSMDLQSAGGWQQIVAASSLSPMLGQTGQIVLDPASQHIYFRTSYNGTCDECRWIWRANYDGSGLTQITQANGGLSLDIDLTAGHLIFSDGEGSGLVKRTNLDGTGEVTLFTVPAPYTDCFQLDVDVSGDKIYMYLVDSSSGYTDRAIARTDLDGSNFELLDEFTADAGHGWGIVVFTP